MKKALYQNATTFIAAKVRYRLVEGRNGSEGDNRYRVVFAGEKLPDGRKADAVYIVLHDSTGRSSTTAGPVPSITTTWRLPPAPQRFYELLSYQVYADPEDRRPRAKLTYSEFCAMPR